MSAKTPKYQIEYALPSDKVADIAAISQRAATRVEDLLSRVIGSRQQGRVPMGQYPPAETYEKEITFPRAFSKVPNIAISCSNQRLRIAIYNVTTTGFTFYGWNDTAAPNSHDTYFDWVATVNEFDN